MLLWIFMAVLTAAASMAVLVPLSRPLRAADDGDSERAIYRDQIGEVARDHERGLIGDGEAEAARLEVARRLLKADQIRAVPERPRSAGPIFALAVALVAIPLVAIGTYLAVGSPRLDDQPFASRAVAEDADTDLAGLVRKVEAHLADVPEDGKGWEVLGPVYMRINRFDDAAHAFDNARRLLGATADREALYGEAVTRAHAGLVTADAREAFERAVAEEPDNVRARFYLAIWLGQAGRKADAIAAWKQLIGKAAPDAPWLDAAQAELARLDGAASPRAPGPSAAEIAAAAEQAPADRQQMIEGMVAGLAGRLETTPDDVEGWARLFRAYIVLGRPADADAAYQRARTALAAKPDLLAAVDKAAGDNGIGKATP